MLLKPQFTDGSPTLITLATTSPSTKQELRLQGRRFPLFLSCMSFIYLSIYLSIYLFIYLIVDTIIDAPIPLPLPTSTMRSLTLN